MSRRLFILLIFFITIANIADGQYWYWIHPFKDSTNSSWAYPLSMVSDRAGNVFQTGKFAGNIRINSLKLQTNTTNDAYLVKYDNSGLAKWAFAPVEVNSGNSYGISVASDSLGNVLIAGQYNNNIKIGPNTYITLQPGSNFFIAKYSSAGSFLWSNSANTKAWGQVEVNSAASDIFGNWYVAGNFTDTVSFGSFTLIGINGSRPTFFLAKIDSSGNYTWVIGATGKYPEFSNGSSVVTDATGNIFVTGEFDDTLNLVAKTIISKPNADVFLSELDANGNVIWIADGTFPTFAGKVTRWMGTKVLDIDRSGNLYIT